MPKVIITGASGLLGRAIYNEFIQQSWDVLGFAFSRAKGKLMKIDLNDTEAVCSAIDEFKPDVIIHCAAERSPDKVEKNYEATLNLNVCCSKNLAKLAGKSKSAFLYISTDYVFDGQDPSYKETDHPNPINQYGVTKYEGERAVLSVNTDSCILRVPVLYGDEEYVGESAISSLLKGLLNDCKEFKTEVSNYEIRFPSSTDDIAKICFQLMECKLKDQSLNSIFHWCGSEAFTKYEMTLVLAEVFSLPHSHIIPVSSPPADVKCPRPKNTQLSCERLNKMGIGQHTTFKEGVKCFQKFINKNV